MVLSIVAVKDDDGRLSGVGVKEDDCGVTVNEADVKYM